MIQVMVSESEWHEEKQHMARDKVANTEGLNVRKYADTDEVCEAIKMV